MFLPPTDYKTVFESEVWNVFNALGLKYLVFPFPDSNSRIHRLIPPLNSKFADFHTDKDSINSLMSAKLIKRGDGEPPRFLGIKRPIWYVLSEAGQNAYDELSTFEDFQKKFIQRFDSSLET